MPDRVGNRIVLTEQEAWQVYQALVKADSQARSLAMAFGGLGYAAERASLCMFEAKELMKKALGRS